MAKKVDVAQKAIDSIGKPKKKPALEAEEKFAKMSLEEFIARQKMKKRYKINPTEIGKGGE